MRKLLEFVAGGITCYAVAFYLAAFVVQLFEGHALEAFLVWTAGYVVWWCLFGYRWLFRSQ